MLRYQGDSVNEDVKNHTTVKTTKATIRYTGNNHLRNHLVQTANFKPDFVGCLFIASPAPLSPFACRCFFGLDSSYDIG